MDGKRKVNKDHPRFSEYKSKCEALWLRYQPKLNEVERVGREAYPDWHGRDCPWGDKEREITRQMHAELKDLKEEYDYLFSEETGDER